jgi:transcription elongation factor Elf1
MLDKKVYSNKDSTWRCPICDDTTTWTWLDAEKRGNPVCGQCDEDMNLDIMSTLKITII